MNELLLGVRIWLFGARYTLQTRWLRVVTSAIGLAVAVSALMGVGLAGTAAIRSFDSSVSSSNTRSDSFVVRRSEAQTLTNQDIARLARLGSIILSAEHTVVVPGTGSEDKPIELPLFITDAVAFGLQRSDELLVSAEVYRSLPASFIADPQLFVDGQRVRFEAVRKAAAGRVLPFALFADLAHPALEVFPFQQALLTQYASITTGAQLRAELEPSGFTVTAEQSTAGVSAETSPMLLAFSLNITVMAVLTAVVALALLFISALRMAEERTHDSLILRALGARPSLIATVLLVEAAISGLLGALLSLTAGSFAVHVAAESVLGTASGLFLGGRQGVIPDFYAPSTIALTVLVALSLSLLGALVPALQLGMRRRGAGGGLAGESRWLTPKAIALYLLVLLGASLFSAIAARIFSSKLLALTCAILVIATFALVALVLVYAASERIVASTRRAKSSAVIVGCGLLRAGVKTLARAAAVGAVSIVLIVSLSAMVHSFRSSLETWALRNVSADFVVRALLQGVGGRVPELSDALIAELAALPGVECVEQRSHGVRSGALRYVGIGARCRDYELLSGRYPQQPHEVVVNEAATRIGTLTVGSAIEQVNDKAALRVVGVLRDFSPEGPQVFVALSEFAVVTGQRAQLAVVALFSEPSALGPSIEQVNAVLKGRGLASNGHLLRQLMLATFDDTFLITRFMRWCVASLALVTIAVLFGQWLTETSQERGTFSMLGARRSEQWCALAIGAAVFCSVIILAGLGGGYVAALVLTALVNPLSFGWSFPLVFDVQSYFAMSALIICLALVLGTLGRSARLPTQRAEESLG